MKISLAWVFDHIDTHNQPVGPDLIERFNQITAEIEKFQKVTINVDHLATAQVTTIDKEHCIVFCAEWQSEFRLPIRPDADIGHHFLITKQTNGVTWARAYDLGGDKEFLLPSVNVDESIAQGAWRKQFEVQDYILEVDNKSITNRPDLWGHRGFAREIAAILNIPMVPLEKFLAKNKIIEFKEKAPAEKSPFSITIKAPDECSRFAGLYIENVHPLQSSILMTSRLVRVDCKPIDLLVDSTNYVMLDLGHPMHAFDARKLKHKEIMVRKAHEGEKLRLLDGDELTLTTQDIVIADGKQAVSLAGVMGGMDTGVRSDTTSVFLEAACFDATTIRRTALRHKKRTEASARFEKSLDEQQATNALLRCAKLLTTFGVTKKIDAPIISVGIAQKPVVIELFHAFIEQRLGVKLEQTVVLKILERLAFIVEATKEKDDFRYRITIPSFRATKDITIKEDIVEEIGRFYGYHNIPLKLPRLPLAPSNLQSIYRLRALKNLLVHAFAMQELYTYAFFDEDFLRILSWEPADSLAAVSPVSENLRRLATTLLPNLFKALYENVAHYNQLRFFEWGRVWLKEMEQVTEQKVLTGMLFDQKKEIDFYDGKQVVDEIFDLIDIHVRWEKVDVPRYPWFQPYQTAYLIHDGIIIGTAGNIDSLFLHKIAEGHAFAFELDGNYLLQVKAKEKQFKPLAKYPEVERDVSMILSLKHTVDEITGIIKGIDERIIDVMLIDFFQKPEWVDKKSLTFRFVLRDEQKTMTKQEVDAVWNNVAAALINQGAIIR